MAERQGVPAIAVMTERFVSAAELMSRALGMPIETLRCKSTIKGEEACYVQDTVLRLNDARFGTAATATPTLMRE